MRLSASREVTVTLADERAALARVVAVAVDSGATVGERVHLAATDAVRSGLSPLGPVIGLPIAAAQASAAVGFAATRLISLALGEAVAVGLHLHAPAIDEPDTPRKTAAVAGLSAAFGDQLAADPWLVPLTRPMAVRRAGRDLALARESLADAFPDTTGALCVLLHGLGGSDLQWGSDYLAAVSGEGLTPLTIRYNTGRSLTDNGQALGDLLKSAVACWPTPVTRIVLVGHSMGGLVARAALHHAERDGQDWARQVSDVVTLGTPHGGAPLEKVASVAIALLRLTPVTDPIADLADSRSAGIKDLRHGTVAADADGRLPEGVHHHAVVATLGETLHNLKALLIGDGMVRVASALGLHPPHRVHRLTGTGHNALLDHPTVTEVLRGVAGRRPA